ncbi:MAG: hypothetical protein C5B48_07325 [Candidatus Rokuibacteriota bacterium]|nr:MAG: hypothetical protein C5B48_07325 [Candidatus Rokubacteria bacterium]
MIGEEDAKLASGEERPSQGSVETGSARRAIAEEPPAKFIGFFRLIDACQGAGCPVCRCLEADTRQYLDTLLYESVNDPETRVRLHASWGFCNWHAWMLRDARDPAFGSAILGEDLLRVLMRRLERSVAREATRRPRRWRRLLARLGRPRIPFIVQVHCRRPPCPACSRLADAEARYVETALRFVQDPEFERAYGKSQGLCIPHAVRVLEIGAGGTAARELLTRTLPKWAELRRDLSGFLDKHDYRNRKPFTEAEGSAYVRAIEILTGAPGLFPNQMRREQVSAPRRAAALHDRLAQVAEDRNALELNLAGERADNQLAERVIAELRAELERLRAELAVPPAPGDQGAAPRRRELEEEPPTVQRSPWPPSDPA